jgi:hypothetical protein
MANADYIPSYGEGYNDGYNDAKAEIAEQLEFFLFYEKGVYSEMPQGSYITRGFLSAICALEKFLKEKEIIEDDKSN